MGPGQLTGGLDVRVDCSLTLSSRVLQRPLGGGHGEFAGDQTGEEEVAAGGERVVSRQEVMAEAIDRLQKFVGPMRHIIRRNDDGRIQNI